jgi:hypothetical protein
MNNKEKPLFIFGHPYTEGQTFTVFGEKAKDLTYDYSDHLMLSNFTKWENSVKQAESKAPKNSCSWYEVILSNYYDKPITIEHILFGMDQSNGYVYQVFGYKEGIDNQIKEYGIGRLYKEHRNLLLGLILLNVVIVCTSQLPKSTTILFMGLVLALVLSFTIYHFWVNIITIDSYKNNKILVLALAISLASDINIAYWGVSPDYNLVTLTILLAIIIAIQCISIRFRKLRNRYT